MREIVFGNGFRSFDRVMLIEELVVKVDNELAVRLFHGKVTRLCGYIAEHRCRNSKYHNQRMKYFWHGRSKLE